jgi:hypothetical protein
MQIIWYWKTPDRHIEGSSTRKNITRLYTKRKHQSPIWQLYSTFNIQYLTLTVHAQVFHKRQLHCRHFCRDTPLCAGVSRSWYTRSETSAQYLGTTLCVKLHGAANITICSSTTSTALYYGCSAGFKVGTVPFRVDVAKVLFSCTAGMCRTLREHEKQGKYMTHFAQSTPLELSKTVGIHFRAQ